MISRALSLAAACLLGCLVASPGQAQQNLDAGKNAVQIFNGTCSACHKSAKGLLRTVSPSSLPDFLRQHYTTGNEMAQMLTGFLVSNRGADPGEAAAKRGAKPQGGGGNLRPDAPIGSAATDAGASGDKDQQKADKKPPRAATAKPEDAGSEPAGARIGAAERRRGRPDAAAHPVGSRPETGASSPSEAASAKGSAKSAAARRKRGPPPVTSEQPDVASKPEAAPPKPPERAIDAAVPVPEPVVLPPPSAADVKPADARPAEVKPADAKSADSKPADIKPEAPAAPAAPEKTISEKPVDLPKPAPPAEAAAMPGSPAPPISQ